MGKQILIYIAGLLTGIGGASFYFKKMKNNDYEERLDAEIKEMQDHYLKKEEALKNKILSLAEKKKKPEEQTAPNVEKNDDISSYERKVEFVQYNKIPSNKSDPAEAEFPGEEEKMEGIYLITDRQFNQENLDYEKKVMTYYAGDKSLVDDDIDEIVDIDESIGKASLKAFHNGTVKEINLRNDELEIDYNVGWSELSYAKDMMGM